MRTSRTFIIGRWIFSVFCAKCLIVGRHQVRAIVTLEGFDIASAVGSDEVSVSAEAPRTKSRGIAAASREARHLWDLRENQNIVKD